MKVREKGWHSSMLCGFLMAWAGRLFIHTYCHSRFVNTSCSNSVSSTLQQQLSMSGREFTEESVGKVNLEKLKG